MIETATLLAQLQETVHTFSQFHGENMSTTAGYVDASAALRLQQELSDKTIDSATLGGLLLDKVPIGFLHYSLSGDGCTIMPEEHYGPLFLSDVKEGFDKNYFVDRPDRVKAWTHWATGRFSYHDGDGHQKLLEDFPILRDRFLPCGFRVQPE